MKTENNGKIKFGFLLSVCLIALFTVLSFLPVNGEEKIYDNVVRLHVIANSDSERDQSLKLLVRDMILEKVSLDADFSDKDEAVKEIDAMREQIEAVARETLEKEGCYDSVKVELGLEDYPIRYYDNFVLPEGRYTSLRVIIGSGEGQNWWCVLFPPLCTASSEAEREDDFIAAGFSSEQYKLIKKDSEPKYKVRFKILEMLSDAFGFDY